MKIGKLSFHCIHDSMSAQQSVDLAQHVEACGFGALWVTEFLGREVFAHSAHLLANTRSLIIGSGVANIYARDAGAMLAGQLALNELFPDRFLLGIGVSHAKLVSDFRGHAYTKPVATMRKYLEAMKLQRATYAAPMPLEAPMTIVAALRPKMLALAAELADGAIPTWTPPEHTARARAILGPGKFLCPIQSVMLETDPAIARAAARKHVSVGMTMPNYQENLKWLGFESEDFENGCSDRLIDALVAWGDEDAIRKRIELHFAAGADHVCILPQHPKPQHMLELDMRLIDILAPNKS